MTKQTRHQRIIQALAAEGEIAVEALSERFSVSVMTIRRDLADLAAAGQARRTHGGAVAARAGEIRFATQERAGRMLREKQAIARAAIELVEPGMAVSLDTGTTTLQVARLLPRDRDLTVLTSSLAIAAELCCLERIEVVLLGGNVGGNGANLSGPLTEDNLKRFRVDLSFIGADAVTPDGLFTTDTRIARISQAIIQNADRSVLVADRSKFGTTSFVRFAGLAEISHCMTDSGCPPQTRAWLEKSVAEVTYADLPEH